MTTPRIDIVGAGITGLAAAWELTGGRPANAPEVDVTVWEAADQAGGKIAASTVDGLHLDEGADAFLLRAPQAAALCDEIGLDDLVHPSGAPAFVWIDGRLVPIPPGLVLGAPATFDGLETSEVLTAEGLGRARLEPTVQIDVADISVGELIDRHYGSEVTRRLVGPLIGGISAGAVERLSAATVTPQLFEAGRGPRPMAAELRDSRPGAGPVFAAPRGGMAEIIDRLVAELSGRGVRFEWGRPVDDLDPSGTSWIVTTPAHAAAPLLSDHSAEAAALLDGISFASVVFVTLVYDAEQLGGVPAGSGFLVPRSAGLSLTAASWMSSKWPHLDVGDRVVVRASLGHIDDPEPIGWDDATIIETLTEELGRTMGADTSPRAYRVARYPRAFPHYDVGHAGRMAEIGAALRRDCPTIEVCGMAHEGVGIPACIGNGRGAADRLRRESTR